MWLYPDRGAVVRRILNLTFPHITEEGWDVKKGLPIYKACEEVGITQQTLTNWRRQDKDLAKIWDATIESRKEFMSETSGRIIEKALTWETRLRPMEQINVAFRVKEAYDSDFQKTTKVDIKSTNVNLNVGMSKEEMQNRIMELSAKLGFTSNMNNDKKEDYVEATIEETN